MTTTKWMFCEYDDEGEILNLEYVSAPYDSFWWVSRRGYCHHVFIKSAICFRPDRIARVLHPDET
jgi:hypothetical protein